MNVKSALAKQTHDTVQDTRMVLDEYYQGMQSHHHSHSPFSMSSPNEPPLGIIG